jgi:hypothetical protein
MKPVDTQPEPNKLTAEPPAETPPAWEEIEDGRYQPRRVRGSCIGRELG